MAEDLKVEQGKNPRYLMVSGAVDLRGAGGGQFGNSALYVAEFSTGNMGVLCACPWNSAELNRPVESDAIDRSYCRPCQFRTAAVRTALNRSRSSSCKSSFNGQIAGSLRRDRPSLRCWPS